MPVARGLGAGFKRKEQGLATDSREMLDAVGDLVRGSRVFRDVRVGDRGVECAAPNAPAEAWYRLYEQGGRWYVEFSTPDRWLSHSIEADLMNTGDSLEDLVEEEMSELGIDSRGVSVEHFRDEGKSFVFRTSLPFALGGGDSVRTAGTALLAFEACFRRLGDVDGPPE